VPNDINGENGADGKS